MLITDGETKKAISIRLDIPVLDWFKENHSRGYQSEINRILAEYVKKQKAK